jgi:hypothetical protein
VLGSDAGGCGEGVSGEVRRMGGREVEEDGCELSRMNWVVWLIACLASVVLKISV